MNYARYQGVKKQRNNTKSWTYDFIERVEFFVREVRRLSSNKFRPAKILKEEH